MLVSNGSLLAMEFHGNEKNVPKCLEEERDKSKLIQTEMPSACLCTPFPHTLPNLLNR